MACRSAFVINRSNVDSSHDMSSRTLFPSLPVDLTYDSISCWRRSSSIVLAASIVASSDRRGFSVSFTRAGTALRNSGWLSALRRSGNRPARIAHAHSYDACRWAVESSSLAGLTSLLIIACIAIAVRARRALEGRFLAGWVAPSKKSSPISMLYMFYQIEPVQSTSSTSQKLTTSHPKSPPTTPRNKP